MIIQISLLFFSFKLAMFMYGVIALELGISFRITHPSYIENEELVSISIRPCLLFNFRKNMFLELVLFIPRMKS